jgi:uncharacterized protein YjbI with pentapeptide repeats
MPEIRPEEQVEPLLKAANEAAHHVQNVYLTFLLLSTYIAIIIGSTTDEQLLKVSSVTLPLLNVNLPIVAFYVVIPWVFLLLHFNLLLQFYFLAFKLHMFEAAIVDSGNETRWDLQTAKVFPFPFSHMLVGRYGSRFIPALLIDVVWMTVLLIPPGILVAMQIRFLPYHHGGITCSQQLAVLTDLILLWTLWPKTVATGKHTAPKHIQKESHSGDRKARWKRWWQRIRIVCSGLHTWRRKRLIAMYSSAALAKLQDWRNRVRITRWFVRLTATNLIFLLFSLFVAVLPGGEFWPLHHLTNLVFDSPGAPFHRNLRLSGKTLVEGNLSAEVTAGLRSSDAKIKDEAMKHVTGLDLSNRNLQFADFRNALLPKVDLRGANLDNARLDQADLPGADLRPFDINDGGSCVHSQQEESLDSIAQSRAGIYDVNLVRQRGKGRFCSTSLRGANLSAIFLEGVQLPYAQLQGTSLRRAQLSKTNLWRARLQTADLWQARLLEADLRHVQLQGASLTEAQFKGADLSEAQLQNIGSLNAEFQGSILQSAQLQGANLVQAKFQGANLTGAELQGAILRSVRFEGAILRVAQLQAADLRQAQLQGADLNWAEIGGANFPLVDISLSDFTDIVESRWPRRDIRKS